MDEIFKRVLNDKDIFWIKKDIFNEAEWNELKKAKNNHSDFTKIVDSKIKSLENEMSNISYRNKKDIEEAIKLCNGLKSAVKDKYNFLCQMLDVLKSFGVVQPNLPNMDDYGKVIERYRITIIEQFFLEKIQKENKHRKKALKKVLEYVKELYSANLSPLEIAYFVRKLDSLTVFWEV
ncbi:MAG: hypothetical protein KG029_08185 [Bacteroidetes bacterium]|nr:hypothetical protein [Bacteroidota bacterium]